MAVLLVVANANAQSADAALATELFNAGRDLMAAGNYVAACPKLAESARLDAKVGTLGKSAECEERLGHMVIARARWQQAVNIARVQSDPRLAKAEAEFARIDKLVPKLNIVLQGNVAPNTTAKVDDVQLNAASLGIPMPVEIGKHEITVSAPGRASWTTTVTAPQEAGTLTVQVPELAVRPEGTAAAAPAAPAPSEPAPSPAAPPPDPNAAPATTTQSAPEAPRGNGMKILGLVAAGAGVVALGVGTAFAMQAKSKYDDSLKSGCNKNDCTPAGAAIRNQARDDGNVATVCFVVGSLLAAGGVTMFLVAPSNTPKSARLQLAPRVGAREADLSLTGTF